MTTDEYQALAMRTEADQGLILLRLLNLGENAMRLDNAARGLADEAGEVSAAVKKYIEYGQPLDHVNLLEEVGDCLWRLAQICKAAGFTLTDAMSRNIAKLQQRYPEKYEDHLARDRKLEAERDALVSSNLKTFNATTLPASAWVGGSAGLRMSAGCQLGEHHSWYPEKAADVPGDTFCTICGHSAGFVAEVERSYTVAPQHTSPQEVVQDGHGYGHVGPTCDSGPHDWQLIQTPAGDGRKCNQCGKIDA